MNSSEIGNAVLDFYLDRGLELVPVKCRFNGYKALVTVEPENCVLSDIEQHAETLQRDLRLIETPCLTMSKGLVRFELLVKSEPFDINSVTQSLSVFKTQALKWSRVKITGGSEAGKSPLAANLLGLWSEHREMELFLSNPTFGSRKDFWTIPTTWKNYEEALQGLESLHDAILSRRESDIRAKLAGKPTPDHSFQLFIFDEIDNTLSLAPKPKRGSEDFNYTEGLKVAFKYASHENVGIILIGQSPYSSDVGFKQADFANLVNVHIGATALKAIDLSQEPRSLKDKLTNDYKLISEHYRDLNRGVSDPKLMKRFALVVDNVASPWFTEIPQIGQWG